MGQDRTVDPLIAVAVLLAAQATAPTSLAKAMEVISDCPKAKSATDIVVCRRADPSSPFRIPRELRDQGFDIHGSIDSVSRERNRLIEEGASGVTSCTVVGTNGHIGCEIRKYHEWIEQKAGH